DLALQRIVRFVCDRPGADPVRPLRLDLLAGRVEERAALGRVTVELGEFLAVLALHRRLLRARMRDCDPGRRPVRPARRYCLDPGIRVDVMLRVAFTLSVLVALAGCAGMSEQACLVSDWQTVGFEDGAAGRSVSSIG